jgi:hypothetical protein
MGHVDIVKLLLEAGGDPSLCDNEKHTPAQLLRSLATKKELEEDGPKKATLDLLLKAASGATKSAK